MFENFMSDPTTTYTHSKVTCMVHSEIHHVVTHTDKYSCIYIFYKGVYMLLVDYHLGLGMCYIHEDGLYYLWNDIYIIFTMLDHI